MFILIITHMLNTSGSIVTSRSVMDNTWLFFLILLVISPICFDLLWRNYFVFTEWLASLCLLPLPFFIFLFCLFFPRLSLFLQNTVTGATWHCVFLSRVIFELDKKLKVNLQSGWDHKLLTRRLFPTEISYLSNVLPTLLLSVLTVWLSCISSISGIYRFCTDMSVYWAHAAVVPGLWRSGLLTCTGCAEHRGSSSRSDRFLQRKRLPRLSCIRLWLCPVQHPLLFQCPCPKTEPEWEKSHHKPISDARGCQAAGPEPKPLPYLCCSVR